MVIREDEASGQERNDMESVQSSCYNSTAKSQVNLQYSLYWDERCGFQPTPESDIVHWSKFNVNIFSDEPCPESALAGLKGHEGEWIDLRPYMIELPQKLSRFNTLSKALELFRTYHLRHLVIVNAQDDSIAGILTRKDFDAIVKYDYDVE